MCADSLTKSVTAGITRQLVPGQPCHAKYRVSFCQTDFQKLETQAALAELSIPVNPGEGVSPEAVKTSDPGFRRNDADRLLQEAHKATPFFFGFVLKYASWILYTHQGCDLEKAMFCET
jgi:hypothetical protein